MSSLLFKEASQREASIATFIQDAYVLFEKLCDTAIKPPNTSHLLASKILALELMLSILERSSERYRYYSVILLLVSWFMFLYSLRAVPMFITAIKTILCPSILQTCLSGVTKVASLSLRIFVALVTGFQEHLKKEVEIFILHLFLKIIEVRLLFSLLCVKY